MDEIIKNLVRNNKILIHLYGGIVKKQVIEAEKNIQKLQNTDEVKLSNEKQDKIIAYICKLHIGLLSERKEYLKTTFIDKLPIQNIDKLDITTNIDTYDFEILLNHFFTAFHHIRKIQYQILEFICDTLGIIFKQDEIYWIQTYTAIYEDLINDGRVNQGPDIFQQIILNEQERIQKICDQLSTDDNHNHNCSDISHFIELLRTIPLSIKSSLENKVVRLVIQIKNRLHSLKDTFSPNKLSVEETVQLDNHVFQIITKLREIFENCPNIHIQSVDLGSFQNRIDNLQKTLDELIIVLTRLIDDCFICIDDGETYKNISQLRYLKTELRKLINYGDNLNIFRGMVQIKDYFSSKKITKQDKLSLKLKQKCIELLTKIHNKYGTSLSEESSKIIMTILTQLENISDIKDLDKHVITQCQDKLSEVRIPILLVFSKCDKYLNKLDKYLTELKFNL